MPEEAQTTLRPIRKLLVANRSEIAIRVFRTATELGIRTVAIYSHEDRFALHRFKADEAYRVGQSREPIRAYLDIAGIVNMARQHDVDAVHPGYGFLSENANFARACHEAGLSFVGPSVAILEQLGDKVVARGLAQKAGVPVLPGSTAVPTNEEAHKLAAKLGFPLMVKAAMGGGGRGMRVAANAEKLNDALDQARREAGSAFGVPDVFLEKYIARARHIEVQLLGDHHGNLIHLFERDCSLQRRHQKMVEIAPALSLDPSLRQRILDAALAVGRAVRLDSAGTVEFLVDVDGGNFYFIEVNPRIQVEHTVTEEVTGYDIVKCQILVAQGLPLSDPEIGLDDQGRVTTHGHALQCRVTTEDPANNFLPDYGKLSNYRSASGMGIRLDAGSAFTGAVITPFYDSMLVKVTAHGLRFVDAARRMLRSLQEFRVRGVKTNIPFLVNLVTNPAFLAGGCTTRFIDETPTLFKFARRQDRATRLLSYIADVIVNGHPLIPRKPAGISREPIAVPASGSGVPPAGSETTLSRGTRDEFREQGPDKFARWVLEQRRLLLTDTTFRDAHQSLLATRMRTYDMLRIAPFYAARLSGLFSLEMWGGATFDTAMRFLKESPWQRLADLRSRIPNILFQMLLRSASAVGYTNYPDNVVQAFVKESAQAGIDLFRIFDALNGLPNLQLAIDAVRSTGMLCEAAICYTGDILDPSREKYNLAYYVNLAKELEKRGANLLAIKDMAGLCKPYAAQVLVRTLRQEIGIPIHFHTHDCAGGQIASYLVAAEEGASIVDCAMAPFSSMTSQPSLHALVEAMRFQPRATELNGDALQEVADYWSSVRRLYSPFETGQMAPTADVYLNEMPGGQYTNLYHQAQALGLDSRWREVCRMYAEVNRMFGDIIKVTPTSKVVGDMALFMVGNNLSPDAVLHGTRELSFPESVIEFFEGRLGEPPGGFPEALQKRVLRGRPPLFPPPTLGGEKGGGRPGASLPPIDFVAARTTLEQQIGRSVADRELLSYLLYPRVFLELAAHQGKYSDTSVLPTPLFLYGMEAGEETSIDIERGKTLILKFVAVGEAHADGSRTVFFELNGQPREIVVIDRGLGAKVAAHPKAEPGNLNHVGAPMPGLVVRVMVEAEEHVVAGQKLVTLEAMKMETTIYAERPGVVAEVLVPAGTQVDAGDLLLRYEG